MGKEEFIKLIMEKIENERMQYYVKIGDYANYVIIPDDIFDLIYDYSKETLEVIHGRHFLLGMKIISTPARKGIEGIEVL